MRKLLVANWKMHGTSSMMEDWTRAIRACAESAGEKAKIIICPPAILLGQARLAVTGISIALGAQDCHAVAEGAYTGDISAAMLKDAGCAYVIVGHSERRVYHHETSLQVAQKANSAIAYGITPIICIGETLEQREGGTAVEFIRKQVQESLPAHALSGDFILAYEPVWAIGSGKTATVSDIADMHAAIIACACAITGFTPADIPVIYGGSVKADNAGEILSTVGVSGILVGSASIKPEEFCQIVHSAPSL